MKLKLPSRHLILLGAMLLAATALILLIMPRADRQTYSYELNQPWKYPLLTAEYDTPILRDSNSAKILKDSIEANFIPFAKRLDGVAAAQTDRLNRALKDIASPKETALLTRILAETYADGIVEQPLYQLIHHGNNTHLRLLSTEQNGGEEIATVEGGSLRSPRQAFDHIDSIYSTHTGTQRRQLDAEIAKAISLSLQPDVVIDTLNDTKYRNQEYLDVTAATGVIKKGQRIVDRGEIITPQIYTNLNTYQEILLSQRSDTTSRSYYIAGQALYILICFLMLYLFLAFFRSTFFSDLRKMSFLMLFITVFVISAILTFEYFSFGIYLVPFAAVPVVVLVFFDSRTAIFALLTSVLIAALVATYQFQFIFLELAAGLFSTFSIHHLSRRSQLLRTALVSLVSYVVAYVAICILTEGDLSRFNPGMLLIFTFNALILSFAYVLIFIVEKIWGFTSTVTLVELSDINNPLLRRLAEEAPGTFQHSMQVSTLAAEAARAIGANTQLVRTGALYHDIGKMESPVFYTENQHGINPHAGLDPETSAKKIISHVTQGMKMASKAKLPSVIKDFITQHHGRGLTKYFYNTAVNESNGTPVEREAFMYPGPNPQSKETAILMMADCVEAASRSLKDYSPESIDALVERLIDSQIQDGLLKESPLSFADVEKIKQTFKKRLATIYHTRVAYPTIKK